MGSGCSSEKTGSMVQLNRDNIPNFKIVLIGDPGVGKTNVLLRYSKRQFDYSYRPTHKVTINHVVEKINVPQNLVVSLTIYDIPGSEDMDLRSTYYRNVDAAIAIVDMSDANSIELAEIWKQDFLNKATKTRETIETLPSGVCTTHVENVKDFDPQSVPVLLLGNKYDLVEEKIQRDEMKGALLNSDDDEVIFIPVEETGEESSKEDEDKPHLAEMKIDGRENQSGTESINPDSELGKIFSPQRGPSQNEKVHECVKLLEEIEGKHKFVGSIMVSAKDDDGSVDAAMKSLVRYLLDKSKFIQPKSSVEKKEKIKQKNKKKHRATDYKKLSPVGIQEFDTIFNRCDVPVKKCGDYEVYYDLCLKRVKQSCADQGYLTESGSSLEDTIVALREAVSESFGRELEVETEGDFIRLTFPLDDEDEDDKLKIKQNRPLLAILDNFHHEYAAVCKAILRDGPNIVAVLEKLDTKVENEMELVESKVMELVMKDASEGKPMDEKKYRERLEITKAACERNRARIAHARKQMGGLINTVENAIKKIKASLLW